MLDEGMQCVEMGLEVEGVNAVVQEIGDGQDEEEPEPQQKHQVKLETEE